MTHWPPHYLPLVTTAVDAASLYPDGAPVLTAEQAAHVLHVWGSESRSQARRLCRDYGGSGGNQGMAVSVGQAIRADWKKVCGILSSRVATVSDEC